MYKEIPVEVDDYGSILIHFENGASGVFTVCQLCAECKVSIDLQVYRSQSSLVWNHEQPSQLWCGHSEKAWIKVD